MTVTNDACAKSTQALPPGPVLCGGRDTAAPGSRIEQAPPFGETANWSCRDLETANVGHAEISAQRRCGRRIIRQSGWRASLVALALVSLFGHAACTGSPATLALRPDFEVKTSVGIASVSIREHCLG